MTLAFIAGFMIGLSVGVFTVAIFGMNNLTEQGDEDVRRK